MGTWKTANWISYSAILAASAGTANAVPAPPPAPKPVERVAMMGCVRWKSLPKKPNPYSNPLHEPSIGGCTTGAEVFYSAVAVDAKFAELNARLAQTQQAMATLLAEKEQASSARHEEQVSKLDRVQDAILKTVRELDQRILNDEVIAELRAQLLKELSN